MGKTIDKIKISYDEIKIRKDQPPPSKKHSLKTKYKRKSKYNDKELWEDYEDFLPG